MYPVRWDTDAFEIEERPSEARTYTPTPGPRRRMFPDVAAGCSWYVQQFFHVDDRWALVPLASWKLDPELTMLGSSKWLCFADKL